MRLPDRKTFPDVGLLRPWFGEDSKAWVWVKVKTPITGNVKEPTVVEECIRLPFNPDATFVKRCVLTAAEWMEIDRASQRGTRHRMQFVGKLISHKLFEDVSDWRDHCELPLAMPFTHSDAWTSMRAIEENARAAQPRASTTMIEAASRRVAEALERSALGISLLDWWKQRHPHESVPKELLDVPDVGMFNHPSAVKVKCPQLNERNVADVGKQMLMAAVESDLTGPFLFVHGVELDQHLDNDHYFGGMLTPFTNRQEIKNVRYVRDARHGNMVVGVKVLDVMRVDFLPGSELGLIQMTKDVAKVRIGQQVIPVQWEDAPGQLNFKVLAVMQTEFGDKGVVLAEQEG